MPVSLTVTDRPRARPIVDGALGAAGAAGLAGALCPAAAGGVAVTWVPLLATVIPIIRATRAKRPSPMRRAQRRRLRGGGGVVLVVLVIVSLVVMVVIPLLNREPGIISARGLGPRGPRAWGFALGQPRSALISAARTRRRRRRPGPA